MRISFLVLSLLLTLYHTLFSQQPEIKDFKRGKDHEVGKMKFITYEGYIDVPENWKDTSSRRLQLPVLIIKSSSKQPAEPIFWFAGGPGGPNLRRIKSIPLLANHDFVCVGYRGVTGSTLLNSKKIGKALRGRNNKLLSDESLDNIEVKVKDYLTELKDKGIDIRHYTIMEVIEDTEYARKALGYKKINFYSESYGTRIALLYSYKYPEVVKRSVMEVVNPPGHFVWNAEQTDHILDVYDSLYKAQNLPDYKGSIKEAMARSFEKMPKRWSFFKLDSDKIKATAFALMFKKETAVICFDAFFRAANQKDYSGLYLMQLAFDYTINGNGVGDLFQKGCSADYDPKINYREMMRSTNTVLGSNYALLLFGAASAWYNVSIPDEFKKVRLSQTETLMISGNLDVSTPAENATKELLPYLPNGKQVILRNMSHNDVASLQIDIYRKFVANYFDTGTVNTTEFQYDEVNFKPKMRFSSMAKWYYPVVLVLSILK